MSPITLGMIASSASGDSYFMAKYYGGDLRPFGVGVDTEGSIYGLTGYGSRPLISKINKDGTIAWEQYESSGSQYGTPKGFTVSPAGNSYYSFPFNITGGYGIQVSKMNNSGVVEWSVGAYPYIQGGNYSSMSGGDVVVDSSENLYIAATLANAAVSNKGAVAKVSPSGAHVWMRELSKSGVQVSANQVAADDSGNVYVAGLSGSAPYVAKLNSSGTILWSKELSGYGITSLKYAGSDQILVSVSQTSSSTYDKQQIVKISSSGSIVFASRFDTQGLFIADITTDPSGNIFASVGNTYNSGFVKLDSSGAFVFGKNLDQDTYTSTNEYGAGIAIDADSNIISLSSMKGTGSYVYSPLFVKSKPDGSHNGSYTLGSGSNSGTVVYSDMYLSIVAGNTYSTNASIVSAAANSTGSRSSSTSAMGFPYVYIKI
jgi:hypothetical protein